MGIPLERERCGVVYGEGLEIPDRLAALGEEREACVPQVVEPDRGEARLLHERLEGAVDDVLGIEGRT